MMKLANAVFLVALLTSAVHAQTNAGEQKADPDLPFTMTQVATFDLPWRIAFLPDGRMLVTEKVGRVQLVTPQGAKTEVAGVPPSYYQGQNGMLGVFLSPHYATDHNVYLTYVEPGDYGGGLALGRGQLVLDGERATLDGFQVLWRQMPTRQGRPGRRADRLLAGRQVPVPHGGRPPAHDARAGSQPAGRQDPAPDAGRQARAGQSDGRARPVRRTIPLIDPPADTEAAKTAPVVSTYTFPGPNLTPAETWTHRPPHALWPRLRARWPAVGSRAWPARRRRAEPDRAAARTTAGRWSSYGKNYNGVPIPSPDTRPDLAKPVIYWDPVIAPGNLMFYKGSVFPQWNGSALISGLVSKAIVRVTFDGKGGATAVQRWNVGKRVRDIEEAPDGSLWMLEDANPGGLFHLTPK